MTSYEINDFLEDLQRLLEFQKQNILEVNLTLFQNISKCDNIIWRHDIGQEPSDKTFCLFITGPPDNPNIGAIIFQIEKTFGDTTLNYLTSKTSIVDIIENDLSPDVLLCSFESDDPHFVFGRYATEIIIDANGIHEVPKDSEESGDVITQEIYLYKLSRYGAFQVTFILDEELEPLNLSCVPKEIVEEMPMGTRKIIIHEFTLDMFNFILMN